MGPVGNLHLSGSSDTALLFTIGKMWSKSAEGDIHAIWSSISNKSEGTDVSMYEKIKF